MRKISCYLLFVLLATALLLSTGCAKLRGKKGMQAGDGTVIGDVNQMPVGMDGMGDYRFEEGQVYEAQFEPVHFAYDSAQIDPSERYKLEAVSETMQGAPELRLIVEGHCDERGSREYNMALGESRALAVRAYLIGLGVDGERIQTKSYGEENPVAFGHDDEAYRQNRRGDFLLMY